MKNSKIGNYKTDNNLDLERIINEYSNYVNKVICNMVKDSVSQEDIEEIISDVFFVLWKNREKLYDEGVLSSYLAGIARNLVKVKLRKQNIKLDITEFENIIPFNKETDEIYEEIEKYEKVKSTLNKMKKEDILIFNSYYYSQMSINQIAKQLNMSEFSVKSRLYRTRKRIRKELLKGGYSNEQ